MITWLIGRRLDAFEREYGYDASYLRELLGVSARATLLFHRATGLSGFRKGVATEAWMAAQLVALQAEDCGPCLQLAATMAEREGVAPAQIAAILNGRLRDLSPDAALGVAFARAVLSRDPDGDAVRAQVVERYGKEGLVSLAFAILAARLYPTLKVALGFGKACSTVTAGGARVWSPGGGSSSPALEAP